MKKILIYLFVGVLLIFTSLVLFLDKGEMITGESFVFSGTESKVFLFEPKRIKSVYSFDNQGEKIFYGKSDYSIDFAEQKITRLNDSRIPDFINYPIQDQTFSLKGSPRFPPLINNFSVYVDYETEDCNGTISSKPFLEDVNKDGIYNVHVYGDSIAVGAQTHSNLFQGNDADSFVGLLRKELKKKNNKSSVTNHSIEGLTSAHFAYEYKTAIKDGADVVIVEYGMNDHVEHDLGAPDLFRSNINSAVIALKKSGIKVILVGFFQQNVLYDKESVSLTNRYNSVLADIAIKNELPFVDISSVFRRISNKKDIADLTADFLHHPNDFGQKIYFSVIYPYFILKNVSTSKVNSYVCPPQ